MRVVAAHWGAFVLRRRRPVLAFAVLLSVLAAGGLAHIELEDSTRALVRPDAGQRALLETVHATFGDDENLCVILFEAEDVLTPSVLAASERVAAELARVPGVEWVHGIGDLLEADPLLARDRERLLGHPLVDGHLAAADGTQLLVLARTRPAGSSILDLRPTLEAMRRVGGTVDGPDLRVTPTGIPFLRLEAIQTVRRSAVTTSALALALCLLVALPLLRSVRRVCVALAGPLVGVLWLLGGLGWLGVPVTPLLLAAPALLFAVGLTDSVHLLHAWDRARDRGRGPRTAVFACLRAVGRPCVLTSLTTAIGFATLAWTDLTITRQFGLACAAGTLLSAASVLTLAPVLCATFADRPAGRPNADGPVWWVRPLSIPWRPRHAAFAGLALTALLTLPAVRLTPDYAMAEVMPDGSQAYQALGRIEEKLGGAVWISVHMEWPPNLALDDLPVVDAFYAVHELLEEEDITHHPLSILTLRTALPRLGSDPLSGIPEEMATVLVAPGDRRALIHARIRDAGSRILEPGFERLEGGLRGLEAELPGFSFALTGINMLTYRGIDALIHDLGWSLALAAVLITVVLAAGLGSARIGLASLVPNVIPLLASAALLQWLHGSLPYAAAMVFSVALGVAVDDSIHVAHRFQHERAHGRDPQTAASHAVVDLAPALVSSTLILIAGFGSLLIHPMPQVRIFGLLGAVTPVWALLADLLLLPSLLILVQKKGSQHPSQDGAGGNRPAASVAR